MFKFKMFVMLMFSLMVVLLSIKHSSATSQWARKFEMSCNSCHAAFPRLNYFGEQFMRNGYQIPGTQDGDMKKKSVGDRLVIDQLQNLLGIRLNLTPIAVKTKDLTVDEEKKTSINMGNANWLQLFTGGSIYKNTSVLIETELAAVSVKNNWFRLGFHNMAGPEGAANLHIGQLSPMEWHAISGRVRMIAPVSIQTISGVKSSEDKGEDSVPLASAVPGISFYGYQGSVLYSVGISNGKTATDPNQYKNYFATIRYDIQSGDLMGSALSIWGMSGSDTKDSDTKDTSTSQKKNNFWRASPAVNIRHHQLDILAGYFFGRDDNWTLVAASPIENEFSGLILQTGYPFSQSIYGAMQYDYVDSDDSSINFNKITPSVSFFPKDNMRIYLTARVDLRDATDYDKQHELLITLRTMF